MPVKKTTKEEIIKKSFKVFIQKGYYHTSISDLSKACGIEKAHFYYYFKDKKDLMVSVLVFCKEWVEKNMFIHAYNLELPASERMNKLLSVFRSLYLKGFTGCIFSNTALETANNEDTFAEIIKNYFSLWKDTLLTIYKSNYNSEEAERLAIRFFNELNGAVLMMKLYKDLSFIDGFINNHSNEL